ncbi:metabotropic glutamate receptor 6/7/8 [Mytilus galloprovincialis]|uniref:Metabotropic glutamate receptor 6/7/8 n=1 Tax=Mytilus galloprovincialis TaxID=29158 RepID=A0A8B6FNS9_MYTGA|nr:metabotropic glutamate receptor 6/7/8 [Mytilus galloprovincialis]
MILMNRYLLVIILSTYALSETLLPGEITVAALFQIQNAVNNKCDGISPLSVKSLEAVKWTFRKLNENNYIPGVSIGLEAYPTCEMVEEASDRAVDLIYKIRQDKQDSSFTEPPLVSLIGPGYSSEVQKTSNLLSSQRADDRLLQIGFSSTAASLSNTNIYSNFFRVVASDAVQIEVMISLMTELKWNYIAIIYDDDIYGIEGKDALMTRVAKSSICVATSFVLPIGAVSLIQVRDILQKIITNGESPISGVIVLTSGAHANAIVSAASALKDTLSDPISFIFSEAIGLSDSYFTTNTGDVLKASKGAYVVSPPQIRIDEFEDYWLNTFRNVSRVVEETKTNIWLENVYKEYSSCSSSISMCSELNSEQIEKASQMSSWTSYAIKAAYVTAKVLKNVHDRLCSGQHGMCSNMKSQLYNNKGSLIEEMNGLSVNFNTDFKNVPAALTNISLFFNDTSDAQFTAGFPDYQVYQYRTCISDPSTFCFEKIGTFNNTELMMDTSKIREYDNTGNELLWPNINYAQCKESRRCSSCILQEVYDKVYFRDGDLIVAGIVPVNDGGTDDPLACGVIRTSNGNELVEAMEYAVTLINNKTAPYGQLFPGKSIGLLILNSCDQPLLAQHKLLSILNNGLLLDNRTSVNVKSKLLGLAGPYSSSISVAVSNVLSKFGYVQVAYASTAVDLSDRNKYPFFTRVSTPDNRQTQAMMRIIKHSKYNSEYIQFVYSKGTYGEAGRDALRQEAVKAEVCIAQEIEVDDGENFNLIKEKLRKYPFAKIVILFLRSHQVEPITSALNDNIEYGEFLFIGSEAWAFRPNEFSDKPKLVGSIILALQLPTNNNFTNYLRKKDVLTDRNNPWLLEYIAAKYNCHVDTSFDKTFTPSCGSNIKLASSSTYEQEIWTPFVLSAMLALLSGTSEAFQELCGSASATLCDQYLLNPNTVRNKVIKQKLDVDGSGNLVSLFDENGDGNVGYTIYNLQRNKNDANKIEYQKVGTYPLDGSTFDLDVNRIVEPDGINLPSVCPNDKACSMCKTTEFISTPSPALASDEEGGTVIALGVVVGILVLMLVVAMVALLLSYRKMKGETVNEDYNYLNVIGDPNYRHVANVTNHNREGRSNGAYSVEDTTTDTRGLSPRNTESYLSPSSITRDAYIMPYDEQSNKSDTDPKQVELAYSSNSEPGRADMSYMSETELKNLEGSKSSKELRCGIPALPTRPSANTLEYPGSILPAGDNTETSDSSPPPTSHSSNVHHVTPLPHKVTQQTSKVQSSPPLAPSHTRPQQVAVVSGIPKT